MVVKRESICVGNSYGVDYIDGDRGGGGNEAHI